MNIFKTLVFIACLFLLGACTTTKPTALFNGKDLNGWQAYGTEKWYVDNGELIAESGPNKEYGYLGTTKQYKNFILEVEFLQEANGNSGIFIRSTIEGVKISGWQVEVAPLDKHTGGIYESYGRGWLVKPAPEKQKALKVGEWNKMKIKVLDATVTSWLNGIEMVHLTDGKIGQGVGFIALQIHDGGGIKVRWRNLNIIEL